MARCSVLRSVAGLLAGLPIVCASDPVANQRVVVIGTRDSLQSALAIKRDSLAIVDSVVAPDIAKLPDLNASDAVQRITGVQIVRDRGEGSVVSVRGLVQVETTLNGRELFTAGNGRTLDFADVAAEMLAGIDVYKSSAADRIEGGIGGSIDLRTRQPFDFAGSATVLSARAIHGALVDRGAAQASGLVSRRFALAGGGELGLLVNLALQNRAWREDQKSAGNPLPPRSDLVPGQSVLVPNGTSETISVGRRQRAAAGAMLQWRPNDALELIAEAHFARLKTKQDSQQINVTAGTGFVPGSVELFPGTSDLRSITWTDAPFSVLSFARDTVDRTRQFALGGRWSVAPWSVSADLSHTRSFNHLFFSGPIFGGRVAQFAHDLSGTVPSTTVAGTDLLNPSNLAYTGLAYRTRPFHGDLLAARLDAQWRNESGAIERVAVGWRQARRRADNEPGLVFADVPLAGPSAADTPERVMPIPYHHFLDGRGASIGSFLVGDLGDARDALGLREAFGVTQPIPSASPLSLWRIRENTDALYGQVDMALLDGALTGQAGLRAVRTHVEVASAQTVVGSGVIEPIVRDDRSTDWLPSASLRYRLRPELQLRAAASRTITRVDFDRLSPSLTLVPNPVNPDLNQGSSGNPELRPVHSRNLDLTLEAYPSAGHAASLTLFWKKVDGFIANFSQRELHGGVAYQISRPYNSDPADVRGAELSYQRFFDFLPGAWRGLGAQLNYTHVDSHTFDRRVNRELPLQNLSRHSGNLIALYEHGAVSARLAYNRRSRFLSGVTTFVGVGALEAYTRGYGWLDASFDWRLDPKLTLTLEGSNLTRTLRSSYYGVPTRPQSALANDRQLALRISARL